MMWECPTVKTQLSVGAEFQESFMRKTGARISENPPSIPTQSPQKSRHYLEPVVGFELLACPSRSLRRLRRFRNLHQFALNFCDDTGLSKDFQPFVQRTFTVCSVDFQKSDFDLCCPFWCPFRWKGILEKFLNFPRGRRARRRAESVQFRRNFDEKHPISRANQACSVTTTRIAS